MGFGQTQMTDWFCLTFNGRTGSSEVLQIILWILHPTFDTVLGRPQNKNSLK